MTEASSSATAAQVRNLRWSLSSMRRKVWLISGVVVPISLLGLVLSWLDPAIRAPLRPGLDFTGGTQIQLERRWDDSCSELKAIAVSDVIRTLALPEEEGKALPTWGHPGFSFWTGAIVVIAPAHAVGCPRPGGDRVG